MTVCQAQNRSHVRGDSQQGADELQRTWPQYKTLATVLLRSIPLVGSVTKHSATPLWFSELFEMWVKCNSKQEGPECETFQTF